MSNVTVIITASYDLTESAHAALVLAGTPTTRTQTISIEVDAAQAVAAGIAQIRDDGAVKQSTNEHGQRYLLSGKADWHTSDNWSRYDHVLTVDEAIVAYQATLAALETAKRERDENAKRERDENDARLAAVKTVLLSGELDCEYIDTSVDPETIKLLDRVRGGEKIRIARCSEDDKRALKARARENVRLREERSTAYKATEEAKKEAARARFSAERDAWIADHGSARLKKAVATGMVEASHGTYRDERIALELGADWRHLDTVKHDFRECINPSEMELDALAAARARWTDDGLDVTLECVGGDDDDYDGEKTWTTAITMRLPWQRSSYAMLALD